eukprot:Lithocolla_globosa_v1_NODE_2808_length_1863_cov_3.548673.p2 type:complete len:235 gc:universal NODE_2808_length_1863_cov_3.548673:1090-1794(+)
MDISSFLDIEHKDLVYLSVRDRDVVTGDVIAAAFDMMGGEKLFLKNTDTESVEVELEPTKPYEESLGDFMDSLYHSEFETEQDPNQKDPPPKKKDDKGRFSSLSKEITFYKNIKSIRNFPAADDEEPAAAWWRDIGEPLGLVRLSLMAKKYLAMFASSAIAERLFSRGGRVCTKLRASLDPKTVRRILLCHDNMHLLRKGRSWADFKAWLIENLPYLNKLSSRKATKWRHSATK